MGCDCESVGGARDDCAFCDAPDGSDGAHYVCCVQLVLAETAVSASKGLVGMVT